MSFIVRNALFYLLFMQAYACLVGVYPMPTWLAWLWAGIAFLHIYAVLFGEK